MQVLSLLLVLLFLLGVDWDVLLRVQNFEYLLMLFCPCSFIFQNTWLSLTRLQQSKTQFCRHNSKIKLEQKSHKRESKRRNEAHLSLLGSFSFPFTLVPFGFVLLRLRSFWVPSLVVLCIFWFSRNQFCWWENKD